MQHFNTKTIRRWTTEAKGYRANKQVSDVTKVVRMFNETHYPIGVATRDGLKYDIAPNHNLRHSAFIVLVEYSISGNVKECLERLLCTQSLENSPQLKLIKEQLLNSAEQHSARGCRLDLEYVISDSDLINHGGVIYDRDLDIVVSRNGIKEINYHPYSREADLHSFGNELASNVEAVSKNFIYAVNIVDNFGTIGDRWIRVGDDIVRIPASTDPTKSDGIYVACTKPANNAVSKQSTVIERYEVDDKTPYFNLYKNYGSAKWTESDELKIKLTESETKRIKAESDLLSSENNLLKVKEEKENIKRNAQLQIEKHENDIRSLKLQIDKEIHERETIRRKDMYDAVSTDRKNTTDIIKTVSAVTVALLGIVTVLVKSNSK